MKDLEAAYVEGEGSMDHILNTVLVCTVDDEPRFRTIIDDWITEGKVDDYPAYSAETNKKKKQRMRKVINVAA